MKIKKIAPIVLIITIGFAYACKKAKPNLESENSKNEMNLVQEEEEDFGRVVSCSAPGWASFGGTCNGGSGVVTTVSNLAQLQTALNQNKKVINITSSFVITSRVEISNKSDMTIYGSPGVKIKNLSTTVSNSGIFRLNGCSDIIIRNLKFEGPGAYDIDGWDNMSLLNCSRIWVDHCNFEDGMDGNLDITNGSDYITVTYCKFTYLKPPIPGGLETNDHRYTNMVGNSDNSSVDPGKLRVTYARCWWASGCRERMPRVRFGKVHVVNCYYNCTGNNYCVAAGKQANIRIEKCNFNGVDDALIQKSSSYTAYQNIGSIFNNCTGNSTGAGTAFTPPYTIAILGASAVPANISSGAGATLSGNICGF